MTYAIVRINGSQYKVSEGSEITVSHMAGKPGEKLIFAEVLLAVDGANVIVGKPLVKGASIEAELVSALRGEKIRIAVYQAKSRHRTARGFRSFLTKIKIKKIVMK